MSLVLNLNNSESDILSDNVEALANGDANPSPRKEKVEAYMTMVWDGQSYTMYHGDCSYKQNHCGNNRNDCEFTTNN